MNLSWLPNAISIGRIILTIPIIGLLVVENYHLALVLVFVAGVSDGLDGFLAKRFQWTSKLGAVLDPVADKILLISAYLILGLQLHLVWWVVAIVLFRDLAILISGTYYHFKIRSIEAKPSVISKINTVLQIALALIVLTQLAGWLSFPDKFIFGFFVAVFVSTLLSGLDYLWSWGNKAIKESKEDHEKANLR